MIFGLKSRKILIIKVEPEKEVVGSGAGVVEMFIGDRISAIDNIFLESLLELEGLGRERKKKRLSSCDLVSKIK
jgi:hypothetical protein